MRREHKEQGFGHVAMRITFPTPCDLSLTGTHEVEISLAKDWRLVGAGCPCDGQREALDVARSLHDEHRVLCCLDVVDAAHKEVRVYAGGSSMYDRAPPLIKIVFGARAPEIPEPKARHKHDPAPLPEHLESLKRKIGTICRNYATHVCARIYPDKKPVVRLGTVDNDYVSYHGAGRWSMHKKPQAWWLFSYSNCPVCPNDPHWTEQHKRTAKHERNANMKVAALLNEINELFVHDWRNPK